MKFFVCEHCGNIITHLKSSGVGVVCCGERMKELVPGTSDGAVEKHVPVVSLEGNSVVVRVGSVPHPMLEEHFIEWIVIETENGFQEKKLEPGSEPMAEFALAKGDKLVATYAFCNLHGLWKA